MSGFFVNPLGSNRLCANFWHSSCTGTPYCRHSEIAVPNESIVPPTVLPSLAIVMNSSPGRAVLVDADGQVALVPGHLELVRDRLARRRHAPPERRAAPRPAAALARLPCRRRLPLLVFSGWVRFEPSR